MGTYEGVVRYDGENFTPLSPGEGAFNNRVTSVYRTPDGLLVMGTDEGVWLHDGRTPAQLDTRDGLAGNKIRAIYPDADGALWFATNGGVTRYRRSQRTPSVRIFSVKTDRRYTDLNALPSITTGERVTIAYRAIDFATVKEKRQYRYRLLRENGDAEIDWQLTKADELDYVFNTSISRNESRY